MDKTLLKTREDFIEWRHNHTNAIEYDEKEPRSYPCILLENDEYDECSYSDKYYGFVYLTDFVTNYN